LHGTFDCGLQRGNLRRRLSEERRQAMLQIIAQVCVEKNVNRRKICLPMLDAPKML
jgi:hypothetical protein